MWSKVCLKVKQAAQKAKAVVMAGILAVGAGAAVTVTQPAMATGTDFSTITSGLDESTVITAVVAAAALLAAVGFAKWAAKKLGRFFG